MKQILLLAIILLTSCTAMKVINTSTDQVFIPNKTDGLPGKCYSKMKLDEQTMWAEVICANDIDEDLIGTIQSDLIRLGNIIDTHEIESRRLGPTTIEAIKAFQIKNGLAYGWLDWATINTLKL